MYASSRQHAYLASPLSVVATGAAYQSKKDAVVERAELLAWRSTVENNYVDEKSRGLLWLRVTGHFAPSHAAAQRVYAKVGSLPLGEDVARDIEKDLDRTFPSIGGQLDLEALGQLLTAYAKHVCNPLTHVCTR
jgi:hypothetical protein